MAKAKRAVPEGHHTVTPHLVMDDAARAIEWYKRALGAEEVARAVGPDGKIMHEAGPGDVVYVAPEEPHKFTVLSEQRIKMICIHQSDEFVTHWLE